MNHGPVQYNRSHRNRRVSLYDPCVVEACAGFRLPLPSFQNPCVGEVGAEFGSEFLAVPDVGVASGGAEG